MMLLVKARCYRQVHQLQKYDMLFQCIVIMLYRTTHVNGFTYASCSDEGTPMLWTTAFVIADLVWSCVLKS